MTPNIILIGKQTTSFDAVIADIERWSSCTTFTTLTSFATRCSEWKTNGLPVVDLFVLLQSLPGEHNIDYKTFRNLFPLTPVVVILDTWCEGEVRTGVVPTGQRRIYVHQWSKTTNKELQLLATGNTLPTTASDEEWALWRYKNLRVQPNSATSVMIIEEYPFGTDRTMNNFLNELFQKNNIKTNVGDWKEITNETSVIITDLSDTPTKPEIQILKKQRTKHTSKTFCCLQHAPRQSETQTLKRIGIDYIISKPFDVNSLFEITG
ncbi:MAG: hypothetical protein LBU65_11480 [Planctomycetaceae bacterium]|jgi:hypothetical protein|nr:hypothetical protein [Planctomycetaceae bacterium]